MRGGYRNGAGRPGWKTKTEALLNIDVRDWARRGLLEEGREFGWTVWGQCDEGVALIRVTVLADHILLSSTIDKATLVALEWTPCHFGNSRIWFKCPTIGCGRRIAKLYLQCGRIACRQCCDLSYQSQSLSRRDRALTQAGKLRRSW